MLSFQFPKADLLELDCIPFLLYIYINSETCRIVGACLCAARVVIV